MDELKKLIEALGRAFEEFKAANDLRIKALETKGSVDVVLAEKVDRINKDLSAISEMKKQVEAIETAIAQGQLPGGSPQNDREKIAKAQAFMFLMRGSIEAVKDIEVQAAASTLSDPDGGFTVPEEVDKA
ncbi:MAG: phage major capsid protein, partial [Syntrophorhabdaceae bacterium]|nr:phage major capsid protein [Syntrophorhabdaceae bacterium]